MEDHESNEKAMKITHSFKIRERVALILQELLHLFKSGGLPEDNKYDEELTRRIKRNIKIDDEWRLSDMREGYITQILPTKLKEVQLQRQFIQNETLTKIMSKVTGLQDKQALILVFGTQDQNIVTITIALIGCYFIISREDIYKKYAKSDESPEVIQVSQNNMAKPLDCDYYLPPLKSQLQSHFSGGPLLEKFKVIFKEKNSDINTHWLRNFTGPISSSFELPWKGKIVNIKLNSDNRIHVILGKVGSGKSSVLRLIAEKYEESCTYIPPERGSWIEYSKYSTLENVHDISRKVAFIKSPNQYSEFKRHALSNLVTLFYQEKDANRKSSLIQEYKDAINRVLSNIEIDFVLPDYAPEFKIITTQERIEGNELSSGQNELISLVIEIKLFFDKAKKDADKAIIIPDNNKNDSEEKKDSDYDKRSPKNIIGRMKALLLDEPDVHLHPDSQEEIMTMLSELVQLTRNTYVIIATHSTPIISSLAKGGSLFFLDGEKLNSSEQYDISFTSIDQEVQNIVPIFGAHPLTSNFMKLPILLVEGEDEEWIFRLLGRKKLIDMYPCPTGGCGNMLKYIAKTNLILSSIYKDGKAYLIRDRDRYKDIDEFMEKEIQPFLNQEKITKNRVEIGMLNCCAIENLCFTDDFLTHLDLKWNDLNEIPSLFNHLNRRRTAESKSELAHLMVYIDKKARQLKEANSKFRIPQDSWHVTLADVIAKTIRKLRKEQDAGKTEVEVEEHSIANYLGEHILKMLFKVNLKLTVKPWTHPSKEKKQPEKM